MNDLFELTEDHIKLLRRGNVQTCKDGPWGSIGLDRKRPFGNSDVVGDMAEILGVTPIETDDEPHWPAGTSERMKRIFFDELGIALQIVLTANTFEPGWYESEQYRDTWQRMPANH